MYKLLELVTIKRKDESKPARQFADYEVKLEKGQIPAGVELLEML